MTEKTTTSVGDDHDTVEIVKVQKQRARHPAIIKRSGEGSPGSAKRRQSFGESPRKRRREDDPINEDQPSKKAVTTGKRHASHGRSHPPKIITAASTKSVDDGGPPGGKIDIPPSATVQNGYNQFASQSLKEKAKT